MEVDAGARLDPLSSGALEHELPVVRTAFDAEAMRTHLEAALIGPRGSAKVRHCRPAQAIFLDGDCCVVRYELDVEDATGRVRPTLVTGRFYADPDRAAAYVAERLPPLAALVRGRPEVAPFAVPAACIDTLGMVAQVFPIDGELPTLVEATDPAVAARVLAELLAASGHAETEVLACRVEPVHYNRRHRCMSRYHLDLAGGRRVVLYGKVSNDGAGARTPAVVDDLRATLPGARFALPECLGFRQDLQLVVLTEIPGVPQVAQLLRARLRGEPSPVSGLALEEAVDACGEIAAALHGSGLRRGAARPLRGELARLRAEVAPIRRLTPELGERLTRWLEQQESAAAATDPLPLCQSHGDFTYTQLIFDGPRSGLVDFDTFCQAEPALDLGHFLAYLRFAEAKARGATSAAEQAELIERLADRFTAAYTGAGGDAAALERVAVYEALSLVRQAAHAWQNLKGARLEQVVTVLAERVPLT
jgi:Phosphotransferase enzyme family